jgi:hypothetical protein
MIRGVMDEMQWQIPGNVSGGREGSGRTIGQIHVGLIVRSLGGAAFAEHLALAAKGWGAW